MSKNAARLTKEHDTLHTKSFDRSYVLIVSADRAACEGRMGKRDDQNDSRLAI